MWWSRRAVAAPAGSAWDLLVDVDAWPLWGPTVTAARLDDGGRTLTRGARGAVRTPVGLWVPFEVTELVPHVDGAGHVTRDEPVARWSWSVAGVPATTHRVRADGPGCVVELGAPWWAPAYLPVLELGTRRLAGLVEGDA